MKFLRGPRAILLSTTCFALSAIALVRAGNLLGEEKSEKFNRGPAPSEVEWSIRPVRPDGWQGGRNESTQIKYVVERAPDGQKEEESKEPRALEDIPFIPKEN